MKMLAAQGVMAPRAHEQVALLVLLSDDQDPDVAATTAKTLDALPIEPLRAFLARTDVSTEIRQFFSKRGVEPAAAPAADSSEPLVDAAPAADGETAGKDGDGADPKVLSSLSIVERMKLAMKGTREQRAQLVRDSNRMVATAVLSSPKLTDAEVEAFAKMGNVSEDVLRIIGTNRSWLKNYGVTLGLVKNPKTPPGISMQLINRLSERDVKMLAVDRNVPEALRLVARKLMVKALK
ncbi:MAG: hypothetical protein WBC51_09300 [Vicinamibacterales bacterium]